MSKVIRGGHNFQCPGANAMIDETTEDRKVKDATIKYLKAAGETTIDATPGNCNENDDLNYGTNVANNANAEIFGPIHFNKAYDHYNGAIGTEIWLNPNNPLAVEKGTDILNNLAALGFKNRGLKDGINGQHLHDVKATNTGVSTILTEVCFCEATEDVRIYKKVGPDAVGKAIAEGMLGHSVNKSAPVSTNKPIVPATRVNNSISQLQKECNNQGFSNQRVDGFNGNNTLTGCPLTKFGAQGNITKWLQKRLGFPVRLQTGYFGNITKNAIIKYQSAMGLSADGDVGRNTWRALLR